MENFIIMVIVWGVVIGGVACIIPRTRKIGITILEVVGILFVITAVFLILGDLFVSLLPFILLAVVAFVIYKFIQRRKDKKEQQLAKNMSAEEMAEREKVLKNL